MNAISLCILWLLAAPAGAEEVVFTEVSPLSRNEELVRRMLPRDQSAALAEGLAKQGKHLAEQSIDPARERFVLHVPPEEPEGGYALLVFVPPWQQGKVPRGWEDVLDKHGMIFVSAAHSGNEEITLARREPLALIAAANVMARYHVDPEKVFIGGFSGGSRVAERLALGYPDLFHGALLDAGSDRVDTDPPPPPEDLLRLFKERSRLVFVTGDRDAINGRLDADTMRSLDEMGMSRYASQTAPWLGHDVLPASAFEAALKVLLQK